MMRSHGSTAPSPWITRWAPLVRRGGRVLDVACGRGRHARLFLAAGHPVTAVDVDRSALAEMPARPGLLRVLADIEVHWPIGGRFAGVVVTNYLWRPLMPAILAAVDAGGVLLYETFARGNEAFGRPANPDFLLKPGELLKATAVAELHVVAYEHGLIDAPHRAVVQRVCAVRSANPQSLAQGEASGEP